MNFGIGRNEPCHFGSGKQYKQCCGAAKIGPVRIVSPASPASAADPHAGAVQRALAWLEQHHRKAWATAHKTALADAIHAIFDEEEEEAAQALRDARSELLQQAQINLTEWLLAEGSIWVKGEWMRVPDLLLSERGPLLEVGQRAWFEQMARQPLRLYDVTEVVPGTGMTLCDALDAARPPIVVVERSGSRSMRVGMQLGARVMTVGSELQFSGALYPFSGGAGRALLVRLRDVDIGAAKLNEDDKMMLGLMIIEDWLAQFLKPAPLPQLIDSSTGEAMLFTTDYYDVLDWEALSNTLAAQADVEGNRLTGWDRLVEGADGLKRPLASISAQSDSRRVSVMYRTAGLAERGRPWFNALVGASARFLVTQVSDPAGMLAHRNAHEPGMAPGAGLPEGVDPAAVADALANVIKRTYANWADEPIPALEGRTPRQAVNKRHRARARQRAAAQL